MQKDMVIAEDKHLPQAAEKVDVSEQAGQDEKKKKPRFFETKQKGDRGFIEGCIDASKEFKWGEDVKSEVTEIVLVRHGETTWNAAGRIQGQIESDLNEIGQKQAVAIAERLGKEERPIAIYSSDLKRAKDTALKIAETCFCSKVTEVPELKERHVGSLQGLYWKEGAEKEPEAYSAFFSSQNDLEIPGGGESFDQLCERSMNALERIAKKHKDDYPVPNDTNLTPIRSNFKEALHLMGFHGNCEIHLLCKQRIYHSEVKSKTDRLVYLPEAEGTDDYNKLRDAIDITYYILMSLEHSGPGHFTAAVLSKNPTEELLRVLGCLNSRGHKSLLLEPPPYGECCFSVDSLTENERLVGGGRGGSTVSYDLTPEDLRELREDAFGPRSYFLDVKEGEDDSHPSTEMVDFSDYEFLKRKKKTWVSNIHFLPGDNDASKRRIRMLNDMQLLSRDSPVRPPDDVVLILVSDHFMGDYTYFEVFISNMENRYYYPVLVVPSEQSEESKQSDDPWPGLLMDGAYHLLHVD
ncbi:hypothetical protein Bca52824_050436 [Brassica carinata]|uniref:Uncharacterized protein n=1 Tax=Brassica carinata TaxID=52824 RepID=A0A8X7UKF9_BRACI|nr:hypothetical protein Bca52824_050436 [Brassica carinata]